MIYFFWVLDEMKNMFEFCFFLCSKDSELLKVGSDSVVIICLINICLCFICDKKVKYNFIIYFYFFKFLRKKKFLKSLNFS